MSDAEWVSADDVQRMIDGQLAKRDEEHQSQLDALEARSDHLQAQLDAAQANAVPLSSVPEHSGGNGTEIAPTWSQYDQERSHAAATRLGEEAKPATAKKTARRSEFVAPPRS